MESQGPFTPCESIVKNGQPATGDDIYKCCESRCNDYLNECNKYCEEIYPNADSGLSLNKYPDFIENIHECKQSCKIMNNVCSRICETSRFDYNNRYFDECLSDNSCVINDNLLDTCLNAHKKDIINCCEKTCKKNAPKEVHSKMHPNNDTISDIDKYCQEHCTTSYDIHYKRSLNKPEFTNINQVKNINNKYVIIFLWITLLMSSLFYGLKILKLKSE